MRQQPAGSLRIVQVECSCSRSPPLLANWGGLTARSTGWERGKASEFEVTIRTRGIAAANSTSRSSIRQLPVKGTNFE